MEKNKQKEASLEQERVRLEQYVEKIKQKKASLEQEQYAQLVREKDTASTANEYKELATKFRAMSGYKDTAGLASDCEMEYLNRTKQESGVFGTLRRMFKWLFG